MAGPVQRFVSSTQAGSGSPGGILAIALGILFIGLAKTGRIQQVWSAAFGGDARVQPGNDVGGGPANDPNTTPGYYLGSPTDKCDTGFDKWCIRQGASESIYAGVCIPVGSTPTKAGLLAKGETASMCNDYPKAQGGAGPMSYVPTHSGGWALRSNGNSKWSPAVGG